MTSTKEKRYKYLYIVQILDEDEFEDSSSNGWEGQTNQLKRFFDQKIDQSLSKVTNRIERLEYQIIDSDAKDQTHEKDLMTRVTRVSQLVKALIKSEKSLEDATATI